MEISQVLFEASTKACESLLSSFFSFHTTSIIVSCNDMADYYLYKPQAMLYLFTAILKVLLTEKKLAVTMIVAVRFLSTLAWHDAPGFVMHVR